MVLEQLLLHSSGLIADNDLDDYQKGAENAFDNICKLSLENKPNTTFIYSDVGYIVLGELVKKVSGQPLNIFAQNNIFTPLEMKNTFFLLSCMCFSII